MPFHPFPHLPSEIRLKIWCLTPTPRIIPITLLDGARRPDSTPLPESTPSIPSIPPPSPLPTAFSVCQESRAEMQRLYVVTAQDSRILRTLRKGEVVNWGLDVLFCGDRIWDFEDISHDMPLDHPNFDTLARISLDHADFSPLTRIALAPSYTSNISSLALFLDALKPFTFSVFPDVVTDANATAMNNAIVSALRDSFLKLRNLHLLLTHQMHPDVKGGHRWKKKGRLVDFRLCGDEDCDWCPGIVEGFVEVRREWRFRGLEEGPVVRFVFIENFGKADRGKSSCTSELMSADLDAKLGIS